MCEAFRSSATGTSCTCAGASSHRRCSRSSSSCKGPAGFRVPTLAAASEPPLIELAGLLRMAAADVLSRPALYWVVAAVFWLRLVVLSALVPVRPDAEGMWEGAHAYLADPGHMYDAAAA